MADSSQTQILVAGGGFAGVWAALAAAAERRGFEAPPGEITLVSDAPALTIRPRLYESVDPAMQVPLAPLMEAAGIRFRETKVQRIDVNRHRVWLSDSTVMAFDRLVLATGSQLAAPPLPGAPDYAFSVDTYAEAYRLNRHLARVAERKEDPAARTVLVLGAGFTGLEVATEMRARLAPFFGDKARIVLIDEQSDTAGALGDGPRPVIREALDACRIETRPGTSLENMDALQARLTTGEVIATRTVILATGFAASPLTQDINAPRDDRGRLVTEPDLRVAGAPAILAAGDVACAYADEDHLAYMSCQHAIQLGRFAGHNAMADLMGRPTRAYRQPFYATCLDLGPAGAVFTTGWNRQVEKTGEAAKTMKRSINCERIYPPRPEAGMDAILDAVALPVE